MEKRQRIEIKERDEWSGVAEFFGNIIAKYVDAVDVDALPDLIYISRRNAWRKCIWNIWRLANCKEKTLNGLTILIYDVKLFVGTNKVNDIYSYIRVEVER